MILNDFLELGKFAETSFWQEETNQTPVDQIRARFVFKST